MPGHCAVVFTGSLPTLCFGGNDLIPKYIIWQVIFQVYQTTQKDICQLWSGWLVAIVLLTARGGQLRCLRSLNAWSGEKAGRPIIGVTKAGTCRPFVRPYIIILPRLKDNQRMLYREAKVKLHKCGSTNIWLQFLLAAALRDSLI